MIFLDVTIDLLAAVAEVVIFNVVAYNTMGRYTTGKKTKKIAGVALFTTAFFLGSNYGFNLIENLSQMSFFAVKATVMPLIFALFVKKIYRVNPLKAVFYTISAYFIFIFSDLLLGNLFAGIWREPIASLLKTSRILWYLLSVSGILLKALFAWLIVKFFGKMEFENQRYWKTVTVSIFCTYVISALIFQEMDELQKAVEPLAILWVMILLFCLNLIQMQVLNEFTEFLIKDSLDIAQRESKVTIEQQHAEMNRIFRTVRQLAHDSENEVNRQVRTLGILEEKLEKGEDVSQILNVSIHKLAQKRNALHAAQPAKYTGRAELDRIIEVRRIEAAISGIGFRVDCNTISDTTLNIIKVHSIVSNLLSNAFEAAQEYKGDDNQLILKIWQYDDIIEISVRNKFSKILKRDDNQYRSTKDGEDRGNGLAIVKSFVGEMNGKCNLSDAEDTFIAIVQIPIRNG